MSLVIGLDIGGSTTKIVGLRNREIVGSLLVRADDPVAAAYGAVGRFISEHSLSISDISRIMMTGVGQSFMQRPILDIRTEKVAEMQALGSGGLFLSGLKEAAVVSMGTGTSLVKANGTGTRRVIGSGVGGGTILGLGRSLLGTRDFQMIEEMAGRGNLGAVDLTVGDISADPIANLHKDVTASNFGDVKNDCSPEDLAAGIMNLVYQTIGTLAALTAWKEKLDAVVFTGNLSQSLYGKAILRDVAGLYSLNYIIPDRAEFATAVGAAITPSQEKLK